MPMNIQRKTSNIANIVVYDASGNIVLPAGLTVTGLNTAGFVKTNASGVFSISATVAGSDITGTALTKTDDANVTLTLGGTPATSLLRATSLTLGWTGQLAVSRGGTGLGALGTANQLIRVNAGATALEYFTHTFLTTNQSIYIGTTLTALNRASAAQTLTGVSIDGNAATVTGFRNIGNIAVQAVAGTSQSCTTAQFLTWYQTNYTFKSYSYTVAKCTWDYAANNDISDTSIGACEMAGTVIETFSDGTNYTIRITRPTTGTGNFVTLVYNDQGIGYSPGWRTDWNSSNLTNLNQLINGPGYTTNTGTVTSVSGTGTVSGLTLSGSVTSTGSLTLGGTLSLTAANVNAVGAITNNTSGTAGSTAILTSSGSFTFQYGDGTVGYVNTLLTSQTGLFPASDNSNSIITVNRHPGNYYSQLGFSSNGNLYYRNFVNTAINTSQAWQTIWTSSSLTNLNQLSNGPGYITGYSETDTLASVTARGASTSTAVTLSSSNNYYGGHHYFIPFDANGNHYPHYSVGTNNNGAKVNIRVYGGDGSTMKVFYLDGQTGAINWDGSTILHTTNYNSYAPTLTGGGASGTWGISITGNAASANSATLAGLISVDSTVVYGRSGLQFAQSSSTAGNDPLLHQTPTNNWWHVIRMNHANNAGYYTDLAASLDTNIGLARRVIAEGSQLTNWVTILDALNYNSYSPTLTGGGASGTWGINVTGSAGSVAWANVTSKPNEIFNYDGWVDSPGYDANTIAGNKSGFTYANNAPYVGPMAHFAASNYGLQFNATYSGNGTLIAYRTKNGDSGGSWNSWHRLLNSAQDPYADFMNQYVRTSDSPTFNNIYANGWFRNNTNNCGLYSEYTTMHWSSKDNGYWDASSTTTVSSIRFWTGGHVNTLRGYIHSNNLGEFGLLDNVGSWILRTVGTANTYLTGTFTASGDVIAYSDARIKTNIQTIDNALEKVTSMRGVTYNRTDVDDQSTKVGVIAQEMEEVLPEVVTKDDSGILGVSYGNLAGVFIEAFKEQQRQIEELKKQIQYLVENR